MKAKTNRKPTFQKNDKVVFSPAWLAKELHPADTNVYRIVEGPYKHNEELAYTIQRASGGDKKMSIALAEQIEAAPAATPGPRSHMLNRSDFTDYAISLGVWQGLCEDHGVSPDAEEIEITVTAVKKVA